MGMGAQNRGATGVPAPTQMAMQGGAAPQGLMALMQQRGKGAGMPGGMPPSTGTAGPKPDPQLLAAMQAFQQQGGQGGMPPAGMDPRADQFGRPSATGQFAFDPQQQQRIAEAGLTPDRLAQMTPDQMARFQPMAPVDIDPRTGRPVGAGGKGAGMGPPPGALVSQPAPGKGGGMPSRPGLPSTMVNPARPRPNVPNRTQAERDDMRGQRGGPGGR
jgi:hypothetical protein